MQQKEKNELSREKILSAAIAEFGKKGYDGGSVNVRLAVEKAGHSWVREVAVPNLTQPQLQQVGIRLCGDTLHARVLLRSGGQTTESQPVSLVEDRN